MAPAQTSDADADADCDGDEQSTGLITRARLAVLRDSPAYTGRLRPRDVLDGPFTSPGTQPGALGERGRTPGVLTLAH